MTQLLAIRVTPRSARPGIGRWRQAAGGHEELEIRVAEAPADGAANEAVIKLLARALGVRKADLAIVAGQTSRHKRVALPLPLEEARRRLRP